MRRILSLTIAGLLAAPSAAAAQLLLQPGVRYDFGFDVLPLAGPSTGVDQGGFTAYLGPNALDAGEEVRVDLFPNAFTDAPFYTHSFTVPTTLFAATIVGAPWQDLQGRLSFTMLAGSMVLDRLQARVIRDGQLYEADILLAAAPSTVPEPATLGLTLTGAALLAAGATTRRLAGRRFTRR